MKIAVGNDHRGFAVKARVIRYLQGRSHEVLDLGSQGAEAVDYPDYAAQVAQAVAKGEAQRGILICGTGLGMAIAANKFRGIRAVPVHDEVTAELSRRHNDSNVLCLSGELVGERQLDLILDTWIGTEFEGGRHARRLDKIRRIEANGDVTGTHS